MLFYLTNRMLKTSYELHLFYFQKKIKQLKINILSNVKKIETV